jgi:hypothetical protein
MWKKDFLEKPRSNRAYFKITPKNKRVTLKGE